MSHNYKTWVEVSKKALQNNAKIIRGLLGPQTKLMSVVKSNAYGHGLVETAKLFSDFGTDWLGVDNIDEAVLLRKNGISKPILVMGYTPTERLSETVEHDLRLTIYDLEIPRCISKTYNLKSNTYNLHIKIDTGMSRQGILVEDLPNFLRTLPKGIHPVKSGKAGASPVKSSQKEFDQGKQFDGVKIEGVFTHFANADNLKDRSYSNLQLENFKKALGILGKHGVAPKLVHASATTGLLTMSEAHFDMVRIGIALYGFWPSVEFAEKFKHLGLEPALSFKTRIVQIKNIKKGTPVGYGITEKVAKNTKIAILPVGYFDGYPRALSSVGWVLIGGKRCKILGRISMNLMVVDISELSSVKIWDEVALIGRQGKERLLAQEMAENIGTISYEVVSRINPTLPRLYL